MRTGQIALVIAGFGLAAGLGASLGSGFLANPALAASPRIAPPGSIATCDQFAVLQSVLGGPAYAKPREERAAHVASLTKQVDAEMAALRERMGKVTDRNSPEAKELQAKGQQLQAQLRQAKAEGDKIMEQGNLKEVEEAYRLVLDAAHTVAKREGYSYVIGSRSFPVAFVSQTLSGAFQEIYARPVIFSPDGVDITDLVFKELKVDRLPAPGAPQDPAKAQPAPAPTDPTKPAGK
ncbi:MAG: OmpH family outer membrane protein [Phycisphaerales bacterium]|jgi:Skp family chaperone for outer membrane proteins|nr:OmpH family outer membrane protein [Phycisphaerales bacterium]